MKVCVDARNITSNPTGIGRYAKELMLRFPTIAPNIEWSAIRHGSNRTSFDGFKSVFLDDEVGTFKDYVRSGSKVNSALKKLGEPDLLHSFFHVVPKRIGTPFIVTLHDTIWIDHAGTSQKNQFSAFTMKRYASLAIPDTLRRSKHVIAISPATADRATSWISPEKMTTISHGVSEQFFEPSKPGAISKELSQNGDRYIAVIGNDKPYKNLRRIVDAFGNLNRPDLRLALIGPCEGLREVAKAQPNRDHISFLGKLNDDDLRNVLQHASLFAFPSLVEGFGLPILEAMASGVPTIVSDLEPMRGVAGGASLLFDPWNIDAIEAAITDGLLESVAKELIKRGEKRSRDLTWEETAKQTVAVYERLLV